MSRRSVTSLTMAGLFALAILGRADETPAGVPAETGAVTGLVVDLQGRPVAGAEVWGLSYQEKAGPTRSDADGRFRLPALKADKPVTIWADAPGMARERRDDVHIYPGKDRDIGRLTLLPGTRIRGRVVDAQGKPVAGANIKLKLYRHQLGHTISSQGTEWTFAADDDGRFATPPLPAGDGHFYLSAPGKVRTFVVKKAEPGTPVADLGDVTLPDEMPVVGVVTDGEGKPAPGVEVIPDYDWENAVKTDEGGRFTVHGVGKGPQEPPPPVERLLRPRAVRRHPRPDGREADGDQGLRDPRDGGRCRDGCTRAARDRPALHGPARPRRRARHARGVTERVQAVRARAVRHHLRG